ncbi:MBL fold metallo-hydrolase [Alteromonas sp. ASW11-130]|uniref:MBL fold metallo-hydrolase n=1 Tax=Alteromonas sp. ASW11-130 TaxID=3015775 RepID=UPI002242B154|nr:MBL fold metallo-hydrolase [Alteromonas sp. ASW11-130]MCW8092715.1 MBL fold metallo-hydrolase [Alteromonas sp. ASW11-130]
MKVKTFFDNSSSTFTYIVIDEATKKCAVIDSVLDYDHSSGQVKTDSANQVINYVKDNNLSNEWILETHIHADHITASKYLQTHIGGKTAIGARIKEVLKIWVPMFDDTNVTPITGEQFDTLLNEGDTISIGNITLVTWFTPGHTPACASYYCEEFDAIFVGDTIFSPSIGTARADFPGGSATSLFNSIQRIYTLPDKTTIYLCHDYPAEGNEPLSAVSVGEQKKTNVQIRPDTTLEEFVEKRKARDASLSVPKLLFPSLQTNLRLGDFGVKSESGLQYIKIPINAL